MSDKRKVLIVTPDPTNERTKRRAAKYEALGFEVEFYDPAKQPPPDPVLPSLNIIDDVSPPLSDEQLEVIYEKVKALRFTRSSRF